MLIKTLMSLQNISQAELSRKSGISTTVLCRYLSGMTDLRSDSLIKVLKVLDIDLELVLKSAINKSLGQEDANSIGEDIQKLLSQASPLMRKTISDTIITSFKNEKSTETKTRILRIKKYRDSIKTVGRVVC